MTIYFHCTSKTFIIKSYNSKTNSATVKFPKFTMSSHQMMNWQAIDQNLLQTVSLTREC